MRIAALQNLSSYSLLESPIRVRDLLVDAKNKGYEAVALTDINVTYGLVDFYEIAQEVGIKPLLGMQARINGLIDSAHKYDLIVLAKNNEGFHNLLRLSSAINLLTQNGDNNKIVTINHLTKYLDHLTVIVPANDHSELKFLEENKSSLGIDFVRNMQQILPASSDLYLGVYASQQGSNYRDYVDKIARQFNLELVATEDVKYLNYQDHFLRKVLQAIKHNEKLENLENLMSYGGSHSLETAEQLEKRYKAFSLQDALANTDKIAQEATATIEFRKPILPVYQQDKFDTSQEYLVFLAKSNLNKLFNNNVPKEYQDRLNYELNVIHNMGFDNYFLIVWDVVNHCHQVGIMTGPGRGSASGSLTAFALGITSIDPLKYNLLFERFLNPARHEMPDIDLDVPDNRRSEVIQYMFNKYGMDHVSQILTFGRLGAKQVLRDVGRVFGLDQKQMSVWSKALPYTKNKLVLSEAYDKSEKLQELVNANFRNNLMFSTAAALENLPRHYSVHAAGLIISDQSIATIAGLQAGNEGIPTTQQTKKYVEKLGLLKIDFLALRNLTVLDNVVKLLKDHNINLDLSRIPLTDEKTLKLFKDGNTDSVFQFESEGIREVLKKLEPNDFEDLVAVNALYRPGPMQNIDSFIERKKGNEAIQYPDPSLVPILKPTYGILIYQEQVMQTAQALAGFTLGEADLLRRAMSKKNEELIEQEKSKFIAGAIKNGRTKEIAEKVYSYIEQFANYGFNRSHAVAYTKIAFWLAYIKVHFPAAFYTALLNSASKSTQAKYIVSAQKAGVKVLNPDINLSQADYTLVNNAILVGFKAIKGLPSSLIPDIEEIEKPIKSFEDFLNRLDSSFAQLNFVNLLIKAGCFDDISNNRNNLLQLNQEQVDDSFTFGKGNNNVATATEATTITTTDSDRAKMEEEVLGFTTQVPLIIKAQKFAQKFNAKSLDNFKLNEIGIAVGKLDSLREITTSKKQLMAFGTFEDATSKTEVVMFPNVYKQIAGCIREGEIFLLKLKVQADKRRDKKQYVLYNIRTLNV